MGRKAEKPNSKPKIENEQPQTERPSTGNAYKQEDVWRLLGDQRQGVSVPATLALQGSSGIFWD
jgi:hypothetical protein